jgi:hypothetical protein
MSQLGRAKYEPDPNLKECCNQLKGGRRDEIESISYHFYHGDPFRRGGGWMPSQNGYDVQS